MKYLAADTINKHSYREPWLYVHLLPKGGEISVHNKGLIFPLYFTSGGNLEQLSVRVNTRWNGYLYFLMESRGSR